MPYSDMPPPKKPTRRPLTAEQREEISSAYAPVERERVVAVIDRWTFHRHPRNYYESEIFEVCDDLARKLDNEK